MILCSVCIPWTFPLGFPPRKSDGAVRVMNYQEWLTYSWHLSHQNPAYWPGEIDHYTAELLHPTLQQPLDQPIEVT